MSSSLVADDHAFARPGRALGEYVLLAELARGGMGRVYLARRGGHAGFERLFAVKVMHQRIEEDAEGVLMLLDEAHIASRLHHPNVVSVLDIGTSDGGYYLVMDYVEGCSLQDLLRRNKEHRPPRCLVPIILDALHGLHAVHTLSDPDGKPYGVIHRDISPHNLLVGIDGGCRVTDFGIAKASERLTDTQIGVHKGKLAFMAPEQLRGDADLDRRVDVWAAGVTLYAALTGHHPFRGASDATTVHNVLSAVVPPPSQIGLRPPECLDAILLRALERDPAQRYESAQALGDELREVALREGLLGAPAEVARWVEQTFGEELSERRRRIRAGYAAEPRHPHTASGSLPALPRLWTGTDTTSAEASSPSARETRATPSSAPAPPSRLPARMPLGAWLALATVTAIVASALALRGTTSDAALPAAPAAPEPVVIAPSAVALEPEPPPAETASAPEPPRAEAPPAAGGVEEQAIPRPRFRPRRVATVVAAAPSATPPAAAAASVAEARAAETRAAPEAERAAPTRPTTTPAAASMERNPYLRGE